MIKRLHEAPKFVLYFKRVNHCHYKLSLGIFRPPYKQKLKEKPLSWLNKMPKNGWNLPTSVTFWLQAMLSLLVLEKSSSKMKISVGSFWGINYFSSARGCFGAFLLFCISNILISSFSTIVEQAMS